MVSVHNLGMQKENSPEKKDHWDFFICHAFEDNREVVGPLSDALNASGLITWYTDCGLKIGDNLRELIDYGLTRSRLGIVILSKHFFDMRWTRNELNHLASYEVNGRKVIFPVWHKVGFRDVFDYSPVLADRPAISTDKGIDYVVRRLVEAAK